MRFRKWLEFAGGSGGAGDAGGYGTVMHGGIYSNPGSHLNTGAGGIRSKYQVTDNDSEENDVKTNVDKDFGMHSRKSKIASKERSAKTIDKKRQSTPLAIPRPYIS